jgi:PDZ domain-containing protein
VALFLDTEAKVSGRSRRVRRAGWIILLLAVIGIVIVGFVPAPYVVEQPGPVYNTIGTADYNGTPRPLISIPSKTTYATGGSLDMLTVNIAGNPDAPPSWAEIASAWFDPSKAVVPMDEIFAPQQSVTQSNKQDAAEMTESQQDATAAALFAQKIPFTTKISILDTIKKYPAAGVFKAGDIIQSLNGRTFVDSTQLHNAVVANGTTKPAVIVFTRAGVMHTVKLTPVKTPGANPTPFLGVYLGVAYTFPFAVNIALQNVGGPSAGMMFALGIIDKLTPGKLNGGARIAGTGTITASGTVGAIGGIRQKLYGARNAGATYFLAPKSNCDEVVGHIPSGLRVFATSTLGQSLTALKAIKSGTGLSSLPTCTG